MTDFQDRLGAIGSAPMFDGLDREQVESLAAQSRPISLSAGQVLFRRGTPSTGFYVVGRGRIQLSISNSEGLVKVMEIVSPGGAFGHAVMFLREPYPVDATALVQTHLVFVPATAVDALLESSPAMARLMLASMARRLQAKVQDIAMLSLQSAVQRTIAYILGAMRDDAGYADPSTTVNLPAPKQVLASRLGMAPETLSRAIRVLTAEGLISVDGSVVRIPDMAALGARASNESEL